MVKTLIFLLGVTATSLSAQNVLWDGLQSGPHKVGYRLIRVTDPTRSFPGESGRPVEMRVWYPATPAANAQRMTYARYFDARADSGRARTVTTEDIIERTRGLHRFVLQRYGGADTAGLHARLFATRTAAYANALPARGPFPLVLYGGGANQGLDENTVLWEFLASHGYVVVAVPTVGVRTSVINVDAAGLEAEARDMEVALGVMRRFASADARKLATMGFSWGGAAALIVGMRQPDADAVVALDPSLVAPRFHPVIRRSPNFEDANLTIPILHVHARAPGISMELVDQLRYSNRTYLELEGMDHIDFNSYLIMIGALRGSAASADAALSAKRDKYKLIVTEVLAFLNTTLKGTPHMSRPPAVGMHLTRREPLPVPITSDELLNIIRRRGIAAGRVAYEDVRSRDPLAPVLTEQSINLLGYALYNNNEHDSAREVFLWNVRAHPASANTYDSLADAYIALKDTACAAAAYRKALEKLPSDPRIPDAEKPGYEQRARNFIASAGSEAMCRMTWP